MHYFVKDILGFYQLKQIHKYFFHDCLTLNLSKQKEKLNGRARLCPIQSSHTTKSWQLHFLLINRVPWAAFLFLSAWQSSLFSFKRMNEDKKQSKMEQESHRLLWFMMAGSFGGSPQPVRSFPGSLMESCSPLAVTPSSHQQRLIMALNIDLCLTCVKIPPTL